ncbi:hypothetical protein DFQ29_000301 [Apophysomyces sp. BC1021]|nr:hypothetical protein DFQ29_000301 [Apophysomyces sp. BC1021]
MRLVAMNSLTHEDFQKIDVAAVYQQNFHLSHLLEGQTKMMREMKTEMASLHEEVGHLSCQIALAAGSGAFTTQATSTVVRKISPPQEVSAKTGNLIKKRVYLHDVVKKLKKHGAASEVQVKGIVSVLKDLARSVQSVMREELGLSNQEVYPWNKLSVKFVEKGAEMLEQLSLESGIPLNQCRDHWGAKSILLNQWCNQCGTLKNCAMKDTQVAESSSHQDVPEEQGADEPLSALNTDEELDLWVPSSVPRHLPIHLPTEKSTKKRRRATVSHAVSNPRISTSFFPMVQDVLPEYSKKIVNELNEQRERINEHNSLYNEINRLTEELSTAHERIVELEAINSRLNARLNETPETQNSTSTFIDNEFPTLSSLSQQQPDLLDSLWADFQRTQSLHATLPTKINPEKFQRQQTVATRMLSPPSATHGYKYIYYPARTRIPAGQIGRRLRQLGVTNSRILNTHFPERKIMAPLIHNDFVEELQQSLAKFGITHITEFDTLDPVNLKDPKYDDLTQDERVHKAHEHHRLRLYKSIENLWPPVKSSVVRAFAEENWLPEEALQALFKHPERHPSNIFS